MLFKGDCEGCGEKPTIFLSQIVNGELRTYNLCRECPHMDEVDDPAGCALAEMLLKLSDKAPSLGSKLGENDGKFPESGSEDEDLAGSGEDLAVAARAVDSRCGCGMSVQDFEQSQRLGCPNCYETFREMLMNTLKISQTRGGSHRGKVPRGMQEYALRRESLDRELEDAIHSENFERAARIRDLMRQLDHGAPRK